MERVLGSQRVYQGRVVELRVDTLRLPGGRIVEREVIHHRGAVAMVALDDDGDVLLVRQYRHPAGRALLEIPAGTLDEGEEPLACARRELHEETGYIAREFTQIAGFYSAPGFCTEYMWVYLVQGLQPGPQAADEDEDIQLVKVPLAQALEMIRSGEICDAKSIIGLLTVWQMTHLG